MFLGDLDKDKKELFLELAKYVIKSDGVIQDEESKLLNEYCQEMQLPFRSYETDKELDDILVELKSVCTDLEINKIMVEIVALALSDNEYHELEKEFVTKLKEYFEMTDTQIEDFININKEIMSVYKKLYKVIGFEISM